MHHTCGKVHWPTSTFLCKCDVYIVYLRLMLLCYRGLTGNKMAMTKYLEGSLKAKNNDLNKTITTVETTKEEMSSQLREGLIKFSEIGPEIVICQGSINDEIKHSVDKMYQNFKRADDVASDCNSQISAALELSGVLAKEIEEKKEKVEQDIQEYEQEKDDAENEKERCKKRVRDAEIRVSSAKEDLKKADKNESVGLGVGLGLHSVGTATGCAVGALLGPIGLIVGGSLMGAVSGTTFVKALNELEKRVDEAKDNLSSKERELKDKEVELTKVRDKIRESENDLELIKERLDKIKDLDRKVRQGQIHVANLSSHIKNCLTVFRTTVGKAKMLRQECLSEIVTPGALVKIINDLAVYLRGENLQSFLSVSQSESIGKAIQDIERSGNGSESKPNKLKRKTSKDIERSCQTSESKLKRARVSAPTEDDTLN